MALPINIEDLLRQRRVESSRIEFKKGWNPERIYRTIGAFANDFENIGGGYILVGVEEENGVAKRPVIGIPPEQLDKIQRDMQKYNNLIEPYYLPRPSVEDVDGKQILVIWVPSGEHRPYAVPENVNAKLKAPRYYIRNGSTTIEAKGEALDELRDMANRTPFDERGNAEIKLSDISPWLVRDYLKAANSRLDNIIAEDGSNEALMSVLEQMDLLVGPTEDRRFRNVAAMMFCEKPEKFFPYSRIEIVIFEKSRIETPDKFTEIGPVSGSVPQMVKETMRILKSLVIKEKVQKIPTQSEALRAFNYPEEALEEAIVNSLYHRNWQEREPVEIVVEEDEITILNFPGPDRSISDEAVKEFRLLKSRRYRNKRLGDFLKELDLTEGRSTGIPTIQQALAKNGSPAAFIETDKYRLSCVTHLPIHPAFKADPTQNVPVNVPVNLTETQRKALELIARDSHITHEEIAKQLSITKRTAIRATLALRELNLIIREGDNRTGYWVLNHH